MSAAETTACEYASSKTSCSSDGGLERNSSEAMNNGCGRQARGFSDVLRRWRHQSAGGHISNCSQHLCSGFRRDRARVYVRLVRTPETAARNLDSRFRRRDSRPGHEPSRNVVCPVLVERMGQTSARCTLLFEGAQRQLRAAILALTYCFRAAEISNWSCCKRHIACGNGKVGLLPARFEEPSGRK